MSLELRDRLFESEHEIWRQIYPSIIFKATIGFHLFLYGMKIKLVNIKSVNIFDNIIITMNKLNSNLYVHRSHNWSRFQQLAY